MASVKGQQCPKAGRREKKKYRRLSQMVTVAENSYITSWLTLALHSGHKGPEVRRSETQSVKEMTKGRQREEQYADKETDK